jgi:hypothetical protein
MPNKQPIFTSTPILYTNIYNPDLFDPSTPSSGTNYYQTAETTLIDRVTVQIPATTEAGNDESVWSSKTIFMIINDTITSTYSIYQREDVAGGTWSAGTNIPSIVWNFEGGLVVPASTRISIQASANVGKNGHFGDKLSVTIEGGTYTAV